MFKKSIDEAYIEVELGVAPRSHLCANAENDILMDGIECRVEDVYELIYSYRYTLDDEDFIDLLNNKEKSMLYPLHCFAELSFDDYKTYEAEQIQEEMELEKERHEAEQRKKYYLKKEREQK
tara:strand:+ start:1225 stop:1590 length:366 start_codon:yes stop_codon:yes gene_type:complete